MLRFAVALSVVLTALAAEAQVSTDAQVPEPIPEQPPHVSPRASGPELGVGLDYRHVYNYFYFYAFPSAGYSETESALPSIAVEAAWRFPAGERLTLAPGLGLAVGTGSAEFAQSGSPEMTSYSASTYHAEAFGEAAFAVAPRFAVLGRLGFGINVVDLDPAADSATGGLFAVGARLGLTERLGIAAMFQGVLFADGSTDAGVTSADPSLDGFDSWALQTRLLYRL